MDHSDHASDSQFTFRQRHSGYVYVTDPLVAAQANPNKDQSSGEKSSLRSQRGLPNRRTNHRLRKIILNQTNKEFEKYHYPYLSRQVPPISSNKPHNLSTRLGNHRENDYSFRERSSDASNHLVHSTGDMWTEPSTNHLYYTGPASVWSNPTQYTEYMYPYTNLADQTYPVLDSEYSRDLYSRSISWPSTPMSSRRIDTDQYGYQGSGYPTTYYRGYGTYDNYVISPAMDPYAILAVLGFLVFLFYIIYSFLNNTGARSFPEGRQTWMHRRSTNHSLTNSHLLLLDAINKFSALQASPTS